MGKKKHIVTKSCQGLQPFWTCPDLGYPTGSMVLLYMVLHGSHQYIPSHVSINIPAPAGSYMGYEWLEKKSKKNIVSEIIHGCEKGIFGKYLPRIFLSAPPDNTEIQSHTI